LMADVPVGVLLSGGVDSSALVALVRDREQPMATFSVGYAAEDGGDERREARRVAAHYGTDHHEIEIGESDAIGFLKRLVHHQDEPIADPVCIPLFFVCQLAAESGVKVVLAGEGADEVFWGYGDYQRLLKVWPAIQAIGALPPSVARMASRLVASRTNKEAHLIERAVNGGRPLGGHHFFWNSAILSDQILEGAGSAPALGWHPSEPGEGESSRDRFMFDTQEYEFGIRLPELLLMRIDRFSMANSIEARAPFLAPALIDYMYGQSLSTKMTRNQSKLALRTGLRGVVPDWVLDRPKQGFGAPVRKWLDSDMGKLFEVAASDSTLGKYFDLNGLREVAAANGSGFGLWPILNFALWHMTWIEGRDMDNII